MTARPCLVVGGGPVAERKVAGLLDAGARLTVVAARWPRSGLREAGADRIRLLPREYAAADLAGQAVVFVATDHGGINAGVARDARAVAPRQRRRRSGALRLHPPGGAEPGRDRRLPVHRRREPGAGRTVRDELGAYLDRDDVRRAWPCRHGRAADPARAGGPGPWERWQAALGGECARSSGPTGRYRARAPAGAARGAEGARGAGGAGPGDPS